MSALETLQTMGFRSVDVPLTKRKWTTIDLEDAPLVLAERWCAMEDRKRPGCFYAIRNDENQQRVFLHRVLMEAVPKEQIDHRDHDGLHNRRGNLRRCDAPRNHQNSRRPRNNKSGFKGVSFHRKHGVWQADIKVPTGKIYLGSFPTAEAAAQAYDEAARLHFGEFAAPNSQLAPHRNH